MVEIAELYKHIKRHYPFFDASVEKVKEDYRYLKDFPADEARANVDQHILTETTEPKIAHIRGRMGDQLDSRRSKEAAAEHFAQLDAWSANNTPPPEGYWEAMKQKLRSGTDA
ncbi:hypothetical protein [Paenibacillus sophorae]|nr:hypothetical protein [Paenibacillus sophorae]